MTVSLIDTEKLFKKMIDTPIYYSSYFKHNAKICPLKSGFGYGVMLNKWVLDVKVCRGKYYTNGGFLCWIILELIIVHYYL